MNKAISTKQAILNIKYKKKLDYYWNYQVLISYDQDYENETELNLAICVEYLFYR